MKKSLIVLITLFCLNGYAQTQSNMTISAQGIYAETDKELNKVYNTILSAYQDDAEFINNLRASQRLWIQFRDAEVKVKYPNRRAGHYGSSHSMCVSAYLAKLTEERTNTLQAWLNGVEEGDLCSGSVKNSVEQEDRYLIDSKSFYGISKGDPIAKHKDVLEKGILRTGEGSFDVFYIKNDKGDLLGHLDTQFRDESRVGAISIDTPLAKTKQGVHVGMTFGELEKILGPIEVHGSEIESRTHASKDGIWYLLDAYFGTYEIDKSQIKKDTKIKQIIMCTN
ncbi:MAG: lysozyme inhibitor LprI family protein [Chitinophagales bacterium]